MRLLVRVLPFLALILLFFGCSDSGDTPQVSSEERTPSPVFVKADDPKQFVQNYLDDLNSGQYLPQELLDVLEESSNLSEIARLIRTYHTDSFIDFYYAEDYLQHVRKLVGMKVERMDYQLKVKDISDEDAALTLLVMDVGVLEQRLKAMDRTVKQEWVESKKDDYVVILSTDRWQQSLRVLKEGGVWKMGVLQSQ
jgi:hypothetical protein